MPDIPPEGFLPIFISATLVMIFGIIFVGLYTFAKLKTIHPYYQYLGYVFLFGCAYSLHTISALVGSGDFTQKAMMMVMVAYFILPHFIYFMMQETHEKYEH